MKSLIINPEYECSPLWIKINNGIPKNISIEQINFDDNLKNKLLAWSKKFDLTLNQEYPPNSKFKSLGDEIEFFSDGELIFSLISNGYSNCYDEIIYIPPITMTKPNKKRIIFKIFCVGFF